MSDGAGVEIRRKDKLLGKLRRMVPAVKDGLAKANNKSADEMAGAAANFAPRDTGDLAKSIVSTHGGQSTPAYSQPGGRYMVPVGAAMVTAGNADVRYPHLVEYGTMKAPEQPYFWPAYRMLKKRHTGRASRAINKALKDASAG